MPGLLGRLTAFVSAFTALTILAGIVFASLGDRHVFVNVNFQSAGNQGDGGVEESTNGETASDSLQAIKEAMDKIFCDFTLTEEMDIMKLKLPPFIERFKNPCWYEGTTLQCIPYMYIVGADKCGTTDLYKKITFHPDFVPPTRKEPMWMPLGRFRDANVFNLEGTSFWSFLGPNVGRDEPVENTADHINHLNSKAKILINIRNPIDKLWSEYLDLSLTRNKSAERFHDIVVRGISLYNDCLQTRTTRSCMYDRALVQLTMMTKEERERRLTNCKVKAQSAVLLHTGVFHVFIKDYLKVFPRDQVLIQRLEDIAEDGKGSLTRTYSFLDLELPSESKTEEILGQHVWNSRKPLNHLKGEMWESTRNMLYEFYKPHNEQLAVLLNHSKYNYGPRG